MKKNGTEKICSRGHAFYKSSDCPVCPECWKGYYRKKAQRDFPQTLAAPALRALVHANIKTLSALRKFTKKEIGELHGIGPDALKKLEAAMKKIQVTFKQP